VATAELQSSIRQRLRIELASHFQDAYEALISSGISRELAETSALEALGDPEATRKHFRDEYGSELPWLSENFPPKKPLTHDFGYLNGSKFVGCTREELIHVCRNRASQIDLAWTPASERLVPIQTIPFLFEAIKAGRISNSRVQLGCAFAVAAIFFMSAESTWIYSSWRYVALFVLALGVWPASVWLKQLREAYSLTPEQLRKEAEKSDALRFRVWFRIGKAPVTAGLLLLISVVTITGLVLSGIFLTEDAAVDRYAAHIGLDSRALFNGEWWRILTSIPAQNVWSIGLCIPMLYDLGIRVELAFGRMRLLIVFFTSALVAAGFSIALSDTLLLGSSGGIFGLIGFILSARIKDETILSEREWLAKLVVAFAFAGLLAFDLFYNAAHLGGLLSGLLLGRMVGEPKDIKPSPLIFACSMIGAAALITGGVGAIYVCWR